MLVALAFRPASSPVTNLESIGFAALVVATGALLVYWASIGRGLASLRPSLLVTTVLGGGLAMVAQAIEASGTDAEKARQLMAEAHPIGRIGQPQDIANLALFLASDRASFMTGEYVCVDAGLMALGAWA